FGEMGDDLLNGGLGDDTIDGGAGNDTANFAGDIAVTVDLRIGVAQQTGVGNDTLWNIENLRGSSLGDTLIGNWDANILDGGAGDDLLQGMEGNDVLIGGLGDDRLEGGDGSDTARYTGAYADYQISRAGGVVTIVDLREDPAINEGTDTLIDIEALEFSDGVFATADVPDGGPAPSARAVNDFDGDGRSDILWHHALTNTVDAWLMAGTAIGGGGTVGQADASSWSVYATGHFDGDDRSDVLWQSAEGALEIWQMNGSEIIGGGSVAVPTSGFLLGGGDFDGSGRDQLIWGAENGEISIISLDGATVTGEQSVASITGAWDVLGTGD